MVIDNRLTTPTKFQNTPLVLIVLDGWGIAPPGAGNAISLAGNTYIELLKEKYVSTLLKADGEWVGLPRDEVGSSETGHLTIGAGRAIYQDYSRINTAVDSGNFYNNEALKMAFERVKNNEKKVHLIGLGSVGGVHSSRYHLYALIELARRVGLKKNQVCVHIFSDGRDSDQKAGIEFIRELEEVIKVKGVGVICSIIGRYYAMDRDRRWKRTKKAYELLTEGKGTTCETAETVFTESYQKEITDEFIKPHKIISSHLPNGDIANHIIKDGDSVIHFNFRTDRARQLTMAFVEKDFLNFERKVVLPNLHFVSMIEFEKNLSVRDVAFKPQVVKHTLGEELTRAGIKQARVSETEKQAFVTYYFNGLCEDCIGMEEHFIISSPQVATYDLQPEMSIVEVTNKVITLIRSGKYPFVLVNIANPDMVGHTGVLEAGVKAVKATDKAVKEMVNKVLSKNGVCLITADHGNIEIMLDPITGQIDTKHNNSLVPFIIVAKEFEKTGGKTLLFGGTLADIAPTVLHLLDLPKPQEMTGKNLLAN